MSVQTDWTAPTTREDGSNLSANEIAGYKLFRVRGAGVSSVPAPADCVAPMCWTAPANTTADTQADVTLSASRAKVVADGFIDLALGIAAQDTNGKWSAWSEVNYLRVDFPQEVISALTPAPKKMQKLNVTISFN
ncbi:MAG: hypothetical protein EX270_13240 [Pseudomonadales bacterium]|nr:MAG: hypothetical protein EX270_13240 [Pseudomonadales bacterium]